MTPVFEVKLTPKDKGASIEYIVVRVDDAINIPDSDKLMDFIEAQFPMYNIEHVIGGYKKTAPVISVDPTATDR